METNLLTLDFRSDREASHWSRIDASFSGMLDELADGILATIEVVGYGLPLMLIAFPLALLWRWLWRRFTRSRA